MNHWLIETSPRYLHHGTLMVFKVIAHFQSLTKKQLLMIMRSEQQSRDIYESGMRFLRAYRVSTLIAQRQRCIILL